MKTVNTDEHPLPPNIRHLLHKTSKYESAALEDVVRQLQAARDEQQHVMEEMAATNEELRVANDEIVEINKNLQAFNTDLETSRNDLLNLLANTNIAILFLDQNLYINMFTPQVQSLFRVHPSDKGRPLSDIAPTFTDSELLKDAAKVLANGQVFDHEIQAEDGKWYMRRVLPYRTESASVDGVVITFVDISAIKAALTEKEMLIREIHHRVKNNLQVMSSLLDMQGRRSTDDNVKDALRDSNDRVRVMALVYQNLYESTELEGINLNSYLEMVINDLGCIYGAKNRDIVVKFKGDVANVGIDNAISCCHIVSELMSNSFKYAFPDNQPGTICVTLRNVGDKDCEIDICDDGIGLPEGFNLKTDGGLGLGLVNVWINGRVWDLSYHNKNGTHYLVSCPGLRSWHVPSS